MTNISNILKQGLNFPGNFIKGRFGKTDKTIADLKQGEGAVVQQNGKKVAVYKKSEKENVMLSPVCPHLGCVVDWSSKDKNWVCPCHGSKFSKEGKVIKGPAQEDLDPLVV
ncbi:MAG: Rieske 2Fe-2S domain-containing protein [Patescibacteria group bacterium]|jgi:Rieske Fe-S protein